MRGTSSLTSLFCAAALFAATSLFAGGASAYKRTETEPPPGSKYAKKPLYWGKCTVPFVMNEKGSASAGATESLRATSTGMLEWNTVGCSPFNFVDDGLTSSNEVGFDPEAEKNINIILFRERHCLDVAPEDDSCWLDLSCNNAYDCWAEYDASGKPVPASAGKVIAVTIGTYDLVTGELFDSDMEMNGSGFTFSTVDGPVCGAPPTSSPPNCVSTDIATVVVHEGGHMLGLDHVTDTTAVMYPTSKPGAVVRQLGADDEAGLCAIYSESTCSDDSGCGGCGASGSPMPTLSFLLLGAIAWRISAARRSTARARSSSNS